MKKFLIIGNLLGVGYKDIIPLIYRGEIWLGFHNKGKMRYSVPDTYPLVGKACGISEDGIRYIDVKGVRWFTNIGTNNRKPLELTERYSPEVYKKFDNYDAINVGRVKNIPCDYDGFLGVPLTFLDKHCPDQYEIVGIWNDFRSEFDGCIFGKPTYICKRAKAFRGPVLKGKAKFLRIIIKKRK